MTQQNKGVVSKIFYNIRKNRVAYLEIKWKRQKDLQFGSFSSSGSSRSSSSSSSRSSSSSKRRKRYTKYTEETPELQKKFLKRGWKLYKKKCKIFYIFLVSNPI